ncbi:MAG TPA: amidohydrolase [Desulfurococcaceae archaeon]|nr:amidohydrolase [Desulfurococcaceae archaeon]
MLKVLIGGTVITVTGPSYSPGVIVIENGKIVKVGKYGEFEIPKDAEVIEAKDKIIVPGLIDAHSHLGLVREGLEWEFSDVNDFYSPITAHLRAIDAIDPMDLGFEDAIEGGVTTACIIPGSANIIGGIGAIIKLRTVGNGIEVINDSAVLKMALGPKRSREYKSKMPYPTTRMGTVSILRTWFMKALDAINGRIDLEKIDTEERLMIETLIKVVKGEMIAKIHLSTSPDEIYAAIRIVKEFNIKASIDHAFGADLVAEALRTSGIPVVYGPTMISKIAAFFKYVNDATPVILFKKGITVSVMSDHPVYPARYLRILAAATVKHGLSLDEALKLITINAAKAIGIDSRVGSIEPGKDADLVISNDHPIKPRARIEKVLIDGEVVYSYD